MRNNVQNRTLQQLVIKTLDEQHEPYSQFLPWAIVLTASNEEANLGGQWRAQNYVCYITVKYGS